MKSKNGVVIIVRYDKGSDWAFTDMEQSELACVYSSYFAEKKDYFLRGDNHEY
jgi:hypothetical protein